MGVEWAILRWDLDSRVSRELVSLVFSGMVSSLKVSTLEICFYLENPFVTRRNKKAGMLYILTFQGTMSDREIHTSSRPVHPRPNLLFRAPSPRTCPCMAQPRQILFTRQHCPKRRMGFRPCSEKRASSGKLTELASCPVLPILRAPQIRQYIPHVTQWAPSPVQIRFLHCQNA
jgi:hypothetical protein